LSGPPPDWTPALVEMFGVVRRFLLERGPTARAGVGVNPKGQETFAFDAGAEDAAIAFCRERIPRPLRILSEERGELGVREDLGSPEFTLIIDPVDGSENFKRGIETTCFSVAVLPITAPLAPAGVVAGLIGNVVTGTWQTAVRGRGAFAGERRLSTSGVTRLARALVELECDFRAPGFAARVRPLLGAARECRVLGSSVAAQMGVAAGGIEAYVDMRGHLTPENFMAGALVVEEAGGIATDVDGRPLPPFRAMTEGFLFVASANESLHREVLSAVGPERPR
jgi:myo-inositol-1(or 4)-monophosphatase